MKPTRKTEVLNALADHQGAAKGIAARELARQLNLPPRRLRRLISELRDQDGVAVCGRPSTGYYIAQTADELEATCRFLRDRAMHSLRLESRMRRVSLGELLGQLKLNQ
jgi:DNA-binding IclR family transcriptional regulator